MQNKRKISLVISIVSICILFILPNLSNTINNGVHNIFKKIGGEETPDSNVIIIHINQNDIENLGDWPLKRSYYALLINSLASLEVKKIGLEIFLSEKNVSQSIYNKVLNQSIKESKITVLSSIAEQVKLKDDNYIASNILFPSPVNSDKSILSGHINYISSNGIIIPTSIRKLDGENENSFSKYFADVELLNNNIKVNFISKWKKFKNYSLLEFFDMYEKGEKLSSFKDKIILIGVSDPQIAKTISSSFDDELPGVGLHAFAVENLLLNRTINISYIKLSTVIFIIFILIISYFAQSISLRLLFKFSFILIFFLFLQFFQIELNYSTIIFPMFLLILTSIWNHYSENKQRLKSITKESKSLKEEIAEKEEKLQLLKTKLSDKSMDPSKGLELKVTNLQTEINDLRNQLSADAEIYNSSEVVNEFEGIVYKSPKMAKIIEIIKKVAPQDASVLVMGESGSGKELVANAIHNLSKRKDYNFVAINCAALPENLLESELFGHVKGAFTGAVSDKIGRFQEANKGTLFLDEIGETNENFQVKLLRVLQSGDIQKVGSSKTEKVDVRIVAATNKNLTDLVKNKQFREDLYYRLNVINIELPSLNERKEDIEVLAQYFVKKEGTDYAFSEAVMRKLVENEWKGNIRELESTIKRALIFAKSEDRKIIKLNDLPEDLSKIDKSELDTLILESLRSKKFSHSSINETAKELGGLNRTVISENLRGIFFKVLTENNYDIHKTTLEISSLDDAEINKKLESKLSKYLVNVNSDVQKHLNKSFDQIKLALNSKYKNLPQKYHIYLDLVIKHLSNKPD